MPSSGKWGNMMQKRWEIQKADETYVRRLVDGLGVSDVLARLLVNRGLREVEAARVFLDPEHGQPLYDPMEMQDMAQGVARIEKAIKNGEHIIIYGDYDVDGETATALLYGALTSLGADVDFYIPDRFKEGYGFNLPALEKISETASLLVSVDCGIASVADVAAMQGRLDIVITDHHLPGEALPPALAVINPHRADCPYPEKNLAGVGVAYKLACALYQTMRGEDYAAGLDLVALGTIADIVPLLEENRRLVRAGLREIAVTKRPGLRALLKVAGVDPEKVSAETVGFQLAPRLNAAGRMETARLGARLLLTDDAAEADELAEHLNDLNQERQATEKDILARAEAELAQVDAHSLPAIVLAGEDWHPGVIGIVASRLVETYYKTVIILSTHGDMAKGSCRSIPGLHMYEALKKCAPLLTGFGGHAQAAGLSLKTADIPAFREAFSAVARETLKPSDYVPVAPIEFLMDPLTVTTELVDEIARLEPYGEGNPRPLFGVRDVRGSYARPIGRDGAHLKFLLENREHSIDMLYWQHGALAKIVEREPVDIAYRPSINEWQGSRRVQGIVDSLAPAASARVFPDRAALAELYRFFAAVAAAGEEIPLDPLALTARFAELRPQPLSLFTMQQGIQIFSELGLLQADFAESRYAFVRPEQKLDLTRSVTYRAHEAHTKTAK